MFPSHADQINYDATCAPGEMLDNGAILVSGGQIPGKFVWYKVIKNYYFLNDVCHDESTTLTRVVKIFKRVASQTGSQKRPNLRFYKIKQQILTAKI
jgi:hypothetical protein